MLNLSDTKFQAIKPERFMAFLFAKIIEINNKFPNFDLQLEIQQILERRIELCNDEELNNIFKLINIITTNNKSQWTSFLVACERFLNKNVEDSDIFKISKLDKLEAPHKKLPVVVILDNIRSSFNVGSILRTAECFAFEKVYCCGYTSTPENEKTAKSSMGVEEYIDWEFRDDIIGLIKELKSKSFKIISLETVENANSIYDLEFSDKMAVILGNEEFGLDQNILKLSDQILQIPLKGQKNSLNVGVAFAIAASEISNHGKF